MQPREREQEPFGARGFLLWRLTGTAAGTMLDSRVLINTLLSEHASAAWGGDPKKPRFLGRGGACRPLMTGLAGVEKAFSTP
jgi:hypothetical protein